VSFEDIEIHPDELLDFEYKYDPDEEVKQSEFSEIDADEPKPKRARIRNKKPKPEPANLVPMPKSKRQSRIRAEKLLQSLQASCDDEIKTEDDDPGILDSDNNDYKSNQESTTTGKKYKLINLCFVN
jgi:hypothetical protein